MKRKLLVVLACGLLIGFLMSPAQADLYTFYKLTNNNVENLSGQLFVDVTALGDQVSFKFTNKVGIASSITDVYFDDGPLLGIASITYSAGVAFVNPASPGNLPSGNTASPPFVTTQPFSADSETPSVMANGVNAATEWLNIVFNLQGTQTFADTIAALTNGNLRIGLHVQSIGLAGGSDSYVNVVNPVPIPPTALLLGSGLLGIVILGRRRRHKA